NANNTPLVKTCQTFFEKKFIKFYSRLIFKNILLEIKIKYGTFRLPEKQKRLSGSLKLFCRPIFADCS
ncbi:MAG: hypothetical protein J6M43_06595, partial [Neisseriaceae bacterium]|nr:hypothetical protein [Neisseriaceae bacterium]